MYRIDKNHWMNVFCVTIFYLFYDEYDMHAMNSK